jgi:hypothetical protein
MSFDVQELAEIVTQKIREEIESLRIFAFGEVKTVTSGANSSYKATVVMAGSLSETVPLDVLGDYVPAPGHWVFMVYPIAKGKQNPLPVIVNRFKGAS